MAYLEYDISKCWHRLKTPVNSNDSIIRSIINKKDYKKGRNFMYITFILVMITWWIFCIKKLIDFKSVKFFFLSYYLHFDKFCKLYIIIFFLLFSPLNRLKPIIMPEVNTGFNSFKFWNGYSLQSIALFILKNDIEIGEDCIFNFK